MPSFFSILATLSTIFSEPSSPNSSCSFFSKSSPSESYSVWFTILRNSGKRTVSSRASCGLYMRIELPQRIHQLAAVIGIFERLIGGKLHGDVGHFASGLVLLHKDVDKIDKFSRFLEAREKKILLELFVIILDEIADDLGRIASLACSDSVGDCARGGAKPIHASATRSGVKKLQRPGNPVQKCRSFSTRFWGHGR